MDLDDLDNNSKRRIEAMQRRQDMLSGDDECEEDAQLEELNMQQKLKELKEEEEMSDDEIKR